MSMVNITLLSLKTDFRVAIPSALIPYIFLEKYTLILYILLEKYMPLPKIMMLCLPFLSSGSSIFPPEEKCTPCQSAVKILSSINSAASREKNKESKKIKTPEKFLLLISKTSDF